MEKKWEPMEDPEDLGLRSVMGGRFQDVRKPSGGRQPKGGGKGPGVFAALIWGLPLGMFGWWFRMGQMDAAAAIPCMVVCGILGGFRLGSRKGR